MSFTSLETKKSEKKIFVEKEGKLRKKIKPRNILEGVGLDRVLMYEKQQQ